jgi:hypothetical protein
MKTIDKMTALKRALALAAVLALTGTGWAKNGNGGGPGTPGDLNGTRDSVTLSVQVDGFSTCTTVTGQSYAVKAHIFQPSGRLLAIGIGTSDSFTCSQTVAQTVDVTVNAVPGLTFKPGPATLVYEVILTDSATTPPTVSAVPNTETGSILELHP